MGYFNIFYKITRIIDMLTRKRNRKFIVALCLIGAVVFFSPSISKAEFTGYDSQNLGYIYTNVSHIDTNVTYMTASIQTLLPNISSNIITIKSDCDYIYQTCLDNKVLLGQCKAELTSILDTVDHIDSDMHDLLDKIDELETKLDNIQDTLDNIESILNSIGEDINTYGQLNHEDQEEIKQLLKDYLYGDVDKYDIHTNSTTRLNCIDYGSGEDYFTFQYNNAPKSYIYYFRIKEGYNYTINYSQISDTFYNYSVKYGYTNNIPADDVSFETCIRWTEGSTSYTFTAENYNYFYIYLNTTFAQFNGVTSNYNEGQEYGLYGGLTNVDSQVQDQGEQTRETITNTDIPTSEMAIDTSIVDGVSNTENDNFLTSIINRFQGVISPSATVTTITIPIPKTGKNIVLRSDLLSRHVANTVIGTYITVFWYVVFFVYFFKFAYRVINWIVTGEIIEKPSAFMKYLMEQNAIITASMM